MKLLPCSLIVVTGFEIVSGGAGYTTPSTVTVSGLSRVTTKVELAFGKKFETKGSVSSIKLEPAKQPLQFLKTGESG